jgi:hypothetical protein
MNVAYPPQDFMSAEETVEGLIHLLQGGFENPYKRQGTVLIVVKDHPDLSFLAVFSGTLEIVRPIDDRSHSAKMTFPLSTLETVFRDFEYLDWRSPEILGTLTLEGDLNLAFHLGMSCVRPAHETVEKFAAIRALHKKNGHKNLTDVVRLHLPTQHQLLEVIDRNYVREMMDNDFPNVEFASSMRRNLDGSVRRINRWHRPEVRKINQKAAS